MGEKVYKRTLSISISRSALSFSNMPGNPNINVPSNNQPVNVYGFFGDEFVQQSDDFIQ
jgi:hypothetical protein